MFSEFGGLLAVYLIQPEYDNSVDFEAKMGGGGCVTFNGFPPVFPASRSTLAAPWHNVIRIAAFVSSRGRRCARP